MISRQQALGFNKASKQIDVMALFIGKIDGALIR